MSDQEENPEEVEEVEPKIILTRENIEEGLSQLYRVPGKYPPQSLNNTATRIREP